MPTHTRVRAALAVVEEQQKSQLRTVDGQHRTTAIASLLRQLPVEVDLDYEPYTEGNQTCVKSSAAIRADSLHKHAPSESPRQAHFMRQLARLSEALNSRDVPVFVSWRGAPMRMDKGCVGHALASGKIALRPDESDGEITRVRLTGPRTKRVHENGSRTAPSSDKKLVVLKPLVWNAGGYLGPGGSRSGGGFVADHGYGYEEWNGDPDRQWEGSRVFHTESMGRMETFGKAGRLGIIMTAYRHGTPVALGVATSVKANEPEDMKAIARALQFRREGEKLWDLPSVRRKFGSRARFDRHWDQHFESVRWRAPVEQYAWFEEPLPIDPEGTFPSGDPHRPRQDIVKRHGGYMAVRPDQALAIIGTALPADHPVLAWLRTDDFDLSAVSAKLRAAKAPRKSTGGASAAPATSAYVRYLQTQEIAVSPKHHELQTRFKTYISSRSRELAENRRGVDLQYVCPARGFILVEVKPCDPHTARFAIRTALGQLMDYRQSASGSPGLLIVLEVQPAEERDVQLALDNRVGIASPHNKGFQMRWPTKGLGSA